MNVCKNCGKPLPNSGVVCTFCGVAMERKQLDYQSKMKNNNDKRIMLLSEKYGHENKIDYREKKENKLLGLAIIVIILVFLIVLTILFNVN